MIWHQARPRIRIACWWLAPRQIRAALEDHPDGRTFRSLFKDPKSVVSAATLLAEIGDSRERYPPSRALAADGGQALGPSASCVPVPLPDPGGRHASGDLEAMAAGNYVLV